MYGMFADVESFSRFGVPVIEDCAQAVDDKGARAIKSTVAIFSLHPTKCLTAGEGGVAVSRDPDLVGAMRSIRDGAERVDTGRLFSPLSDLSAALALSQLSRFYQALDRRRALAQKYRSALQHLFHDGVHPQSMYFRFPLKVRGGLDAYQKLFLKKGVHIRRGVDKLLHRFRGEPDRNFKHATLLFDTTILLPLYPALTDEEHAVCLNAAVEILSSTWLRACHQ
jgi:dTDP-4-amino-4,6-dideoxygalactose transaminase